LAVEQTLADLQAPAAHAVAQREQVNQRREHAGHEDEHQEQRVFRARRHGPTAKQPGQEQRPVPKEDAQGARDQVHQQRGRVQATPGGLGGGGRGDLRRGRRLGLVEVKGGGGGLKVLGPGARGGGAHHRLVVGVRTGGLARALFSGGVEAEQARGLKLALVLAFALAFAEMLGALKL
jgi:hypothetical protein